MAGAADRGMAGLLLGRVRPRDLALQRAARAAASRRRAELPRLGDARGVRRGGLERRVLAGRRRGGAFYSYTYPGPPGFRDRDLGVPGAFFDAGLGEFLLPYRTVREAEDPEGLLLAFLRATFRAGAEAGRWPSVDG